MHVTLRDHKLWYQVEGTQGSPVLLIMGFGISGRAWAPQVRSLKERHRVVIFDNRGIGKSESSKVAYGFRELADDSAALIDHLGFSSAHVVGVSMGGMIAQQLALRHSARVKSLTLIATLPGGSLRHTLPNPTGLARFLYANISRGPKRLAALQRLLYSKSYRDQQKPTVDFSQDSMEVFAVPANTTTRLNQLRAILRHDVTAELGGLRTPTLVVRPDQDILVRPANSDRIHAMIPGSRLLRLDAGHGVTHQCAEEVNAALLEHFASADHDVRPAL